MAFAFTAIYFDGSGHRCLISCGKDILRYAEKVVTTVRIDEFVLISEAHRFLQAGAAFGFVGFVALLRQQAVPIVVRRVFIHHPHYLLGAVEDVQIGQCPDGRFGDGGRRDEVD